MTHDKIKALCDRLQQEISWVEALNALLAEEKTLLETRQFNQRLEDCASKKQDLSKKLEDSGKERMKLINKIDDNQSVEVCLKVFLKDCSETEVTQVKGLNSKLSELLIICRELNSVNGQVIANNLYVRQELVNALSGNKADAVSVYNSHGGLSSNNDKKHHREA
jgi:flagella synthesis protein FlgN